MISGSLCHRCGQNRTKRTDEMGRPVCPDCEIELVMEREKKTECPIDHVTMEKEIIDGEIIIDRCPKCGGVWLSSGELDLIKENLESKSSSNFAIGVASGITMGSTFHH